MALWKRNISARVAQLDRVLGYEPGGRRFESSRVHHHLKAVTVFRDCRCGKTELVHA
jgi:hypothetical protein